VSWSNIVCRDNKRVVRRFTKAQRAPWLQKIEEARRGAKILSEKQTPLTDALNEESARRNKPIWLGKAWEPDGPIMDPFPNPMSTFEA
jgi:hypothetical protein